MDKNSVLAIKSKQFALRIINLYGFLTGEQKEYVLSKQILKSGTSIGANIRECVRAQSRADFYSKLYISLKEAEETSYWLELLHESGVINDNEFISIHRDCDELIRILVSVTKKQKETDK